MSFIESLDEPLLAELFSYWSERRQGRIAPARSDIDPVDIPHLLPYIALCEIVPNPDPTPGRKAYRFRYRLAGTQIEARFGCALTHRYLDEVKQGEYLDYIVNLYDRLMAEMAPIYSESSFGDGVENKLWAKRLMLPLSDDQQTANMVLAGIIYIDNDPSHRTTVLRVQDRFSPSRTEAG
ncbi:MAG: PAS domain-containing protein [Kiloniellaceae bacterium]